MKTITLSVDEGVLLAVRRYAAEQGSTVNGMVREFLTALASARTERGRLGNAFTSSASTPLPVSERSDATAKSSMIVEAFPDTSVLVYGVCSVSLRLGRGMSC